MVVYADPYNNTHRAARRNAEAALGKILNNPQAQGDPEFFQAVQEVSRRLGELPDLPRLPRRQVPQGFEILDAIAAVFENMAIGDIKKGVGDWSYERSLSNGINSLYLMRNRVTGDYVVIKQDDDYARRGGRQFKGNGINAEEMVAQIYRDLGFAAPRFRVISPDGDGIDVRGLGVMEFIDDGFFGLENIDIAARNVEAERGIDKIMPEHQREILELLVANGIIGNTDRHRKNYMYGQDPDTGLWRIVPIDNGLALFHGAFGKAGDKLPDNLYLRPDKVIAGDYGNRNGALGLGAGYIKKVGRDVAKDEIREFAERMKLRAELMKFIDDRANAYLSERAQWILDNLDKYLDTIIAGGRGYY